MEKVMMIKIYMYYMFDLIICKYNVYGILIFDCIYFYFWYEVYIESNIYVQFLYVIYMLIFFLFFFNRVEN